ncbi:hypothetical protein, partial [Leifsonia sp. SIMBA_070]|uniref:hypothetical protein n=1 Tax=Leifsonia sp. SIMBA_070 TaxID=3085810 RepID=UPI00397A81D8
RIDADSGTIGMQGEEDGGADDDEVDELIAEVVYPGGVKRSIRYSGARPPLINYPVEPIDKEEPAEAFLRRAREVGASLAGSVDCRLDPGWD